MSLAPKQLRQIEELYFGLVKGKENLAGEHGGIDSSGVTLDLDSINNVYHYEDYIKSTEKQLLELLPVGLSQDDRSVLDSAFERLVKMSDDGKKDTLDYQLVEKSIDVVLPGFLERTGKRLEPSAKPFVQTAPSPSTDIVVTPSNEVVTVPTQQLVEIAESQDIIDVEAIPTEIVTQTANVNKASLFVESLDAVTESVKRIKSLFEDIQSDSKSAIYELNKLKEQPRIDKASKREYKKRMRAYRHSHDNFVSQKISKGLAWFVAIFLGSFLFVIGLFIPALVSEVLLESDIKTQPIIDDYMLTYYKDSMIPLVGVLKDATKEEWEFLTEKEFNEGFDHRPARSTVVTVVILAILSFWSTFSLGRQSSMTGFAAKQYNKLKIPLFTPENKQRQVEIERISHKLRKQVPKLVQLGNNLLREEYRKKQWNESLMEHMSTIDNFGKSVGKITLRGQIREAKRASQNSSNVDAGGVLALVGCVLLACVGVAAVVSAPTQYRVTYSDGSQRNEWR